MDLKILHSNIGGYDEKLDCLFPMYLLYPEIPRYELIQDENYFMPLVEKHFFRPKEAESGDLLIFKLINGFHFGIYERGEKGEESFFHCCRKFGLRKSRLSGYKKYLKDVYRWSSQ